jgi:HNH endonuclease
MVHMPGHPRASTNGYVFEHILVMERILGRSLEPGETVHHRNGVRDDNRPKNLELWIRPQPTGIRVDDAIEWAREIIARYGETPWHPQQRLPL